jgi:hypothetical protein
MRLITLCAALVAIMWASSSPSATPTCYPVQPSAANFEQTTQPTNVMKWLSIDADKASFIVTFYCDQTYGWGGYYFYGYRKDLVPSWQAILASASTMPKSDADTLWTANVTTVDPDLEVIAKRQLSATRPPDIVWRVRLNGTQTSRPVFPLKADGTRGTTAINGERVATKAQCSCRKLVIEEAVNGAAQPNAYCTVEGQQNASKVTARLGANRLAWCERQ